MPLWSNTDSGRDADERIVAEQFVCPRCGYDLHGPIDSWREACPLEGTCPECGLRYRWGELLSFELNHPHWNIESPFSRKPLRLILTAYRTLFMSVRPWRFWRELRMTHRPRWTRLVCYPLVILPILYVAFALIVGFSAAAELRRLNPTWAKPAAEPALLAVQSGLLPFSSRPLIVKVDGTGGLPVRSIAARYDFLSIPRSAFGALRRDRFVRPGIHDVVQVKVSHALLMILLIPVGFAALPISRRVCKVRWRHIARIWIYCLPLATLPLAIEIYHQFTTWRWSASSRNAVGSMLMYMTALALIAWWSIAADRYLKMQWPWLVGAAVVVLPVSIVLFMVETWAFMSFLLRHG